MTARYLTTAEVAKMAAVKTGTIRCYRCRIGSDFPDPDAYDGFHQTVPLWKTSTIKAWLKVRRAPGRPMGS